MSEAQSRRVDGYLVVGGVSHDFDYVRLQLLERLARFEHVRTAVAPNFEDLDGIDRSSFLVSYTCDVRPSAAAEERLARFVAAGRRWLALHATNAHLEWTERGVASAHRRSPFFETLGTAFVAHPPMDRFRVEVDVPEHPLVRDIPSFEVFDELYLVEELGEIETLLSTRFSGEAPGFVADQWHDDARRPIMYLRRIGEGEVLYLNLGHARGHYDAPHRTPYYPHVERCAWESAEFLELLDRGLRWSARLPPFAGEDS